MVCSLKMAKKRAAAALVLAILDEEEETSKRERTMWVRDLYKRRDDRGCFQNLVKELMLQDVEKFREYLRMDTGSFYALVEKVRPLITKQDTIMRQAITAEERTALCLRFLASGESLRSLSFQFRMSPSTISGIIPEVCNAIYTVLKDEYLKCPNSPEEWRQVASEFEKQWNFPNCLGAIDGKHCVTIQPPKSGSHFINYKGTFSVVLMAVADANMKFLFVDIGTNGRVSDGGVWSKCALQKAIENSSIGIPPRRIVGGRNLPHVFIADEAFPLGMSLLKPFSRRDLNNNRRIFNYRLSRARRVIESAFGIMAAIFRVYRRPLDLDQSTVIAIIKATCVLHNMLREQCTSHYVTPGLIDDENLTNGEIVRGSWRDMESNLASLAPSSIHNSGNDAKKLREEFSSHFNNEGAVAWQDRFLNHS